MALVLMGGLLGFVAAVGGFFFGLSPGAALGIWAGSGPAAALVATLVSLSKGSRGQQPHVAKALSVIA